MAIREKLDEDVRKGIIWHTQGSGKTALSYFNVHFLTDYFSKRNVVPKFYFIVDRLDLLKQAKREFSSRGLIVHTVNSRGEFIKSFNEKVAIHNQSGKREITVVNIHKFSDESNIINETDYDINIQRVYFLDEVHRSYDPKGSFLANLVSSDRKAIIIGLTGTPLISDKKKSKDIFGDYIHKYYYNSSIIDGYTLKLIREGIETKYRLLLEQALKDIEILKGNIQKKEVYSHEQFVSPLLDYVIDDFTKSRVRFGDKSIGAMVICDSSEQAKKLYELFTDRYPEASNIAASDETELIAAEPSTEYVSHSSFPQFKAALILHDIGTKDERDQLVEDFKEGKIDFLFVFNMLLTGFDAKRLKKLYMGRLIKSHNLLQALTRVNRPYKKFRYGYVVDFADIRKEFEATNKAYFKELQEELGYELETYSNLFKSKEEIQYEIEDFHEKLFYYDLKNAEIFSQQISKIEDRAKVIEVKNALENARNLFNLIKYFGYEEFLEKVDFKKLNQLFNETQRHLALLNLKEKVKNKIDSSELLNTALENVIFMFKKVSEKELVIADQLKDSLKKTREALAGNFDKKDPEFVSLFDELKRLFEGKNLEEISQEEMKSNMAMLGKIFDQATELNRKNDLLRGKYEYDEKYARIHKRLVEHKWLTEKESKVFSFLSKIKKDTDHLLLNNTNLLKNESYFEAEMLSFLFNELDEENYDLEMDEIKLINACITREYFNESQGICQW
jgi:type I restriction enzyme R subunit